MRNAPRAVIERLVVDVMNAGRLDVIDEIYDPALAPAARTWIAPFRTSFPDVHMELVEAVVDGDRIAARFVCAGTHLAPWRGHPATGRRFRVDEVGFFTVHDDRITRAWSLEDTERRMRQLSLGQPAPRAT